MLSEAYRYEAAVRESSTGYRLKDATGCLILLRLENMGAMYCSDMVSPDWSRFFFL